MFWENIDLWQKLRSYFFPHRIINHGCAPMWPLWGRHSTQLLWLLSCQPLQALYRWTHIWWIWRTQNSPFPGAKINLLYPKCGTHSNKLCKFQCIDCNYIFVCSCCVVSETHAWHRFVEISNVYRTKKQTIERDTEELENLIAPTYEEIALELENQLSNLDGGYHRILTEISKQGKEWHKEINIVINKTKTEINEIKMKHVEI